MRCLWLGVSLVGVLLGCDMSVDKGTFIPGHPPHPEVTHRFDKQQKLITKWKVSEEDNMVVLPLARYSMVFVDWGDGAVEAYYGALVRHVYRYPGIYTVTVSGEATVWSFSSIPHSRSMLISVEEFGDLGWVDLSGAFYKADNMTHFMGGNVEHVRSMHAAFSGAASASLDVAGWSTSKVQNMSSMFADTEVANPNVTAWDVSNVEDMSSMFMRAKAATPDVSKWNTSNVNDMSSMFAESLLANPDVSNWHTSRVTDMSEMFRKALDATPNVTEWDVSNVTNMDFMFAEAISATPDVSKWNTESVKSMQGMFNRAYSANPEVNNWNTEKVTNMAGMFYDAISASPEVTCWNVEKVTDMRHMFRGATKASGVKFTKWNLASVSFMHGMFADMTLSTENYDTLLNIIAATSERKNLILDGGAARYSKAGSVSRHALIERGWEINDAGMEEVDLESDPAS